MCDGSSSADSDSDFEIFEVVYAQNQNLKDRISHGIGHLSNEACAAAIPAFLHPGLRNLFLCHLSGNNNTPDLAYASARAALEAAGVEPGTIALRVLHRGIASPLLTL